MDKMRELADGLLQKALDRKALGGDYHLEATAAAQCAMAAIEMRKEEETLAARCRQRDDENAAWNSVR